jgi:hypothetical protein
MSGNIYIVFHADPGTIEGTRFGWFKVATGRYDDSSINAGLGSIELD